MFWIPKLIQVLKINLLYCPKNCKVKKQQGAKR
mgnify:CR=1 FL=1